MLFSIASLFVLFPHGVWCNCYLQFECWWLPMQCTCQSTQPPCTLSLLFIQVFSTNGTPNIHGLGFLPYKPLFILSFNLGSHVTSIWGAQNAYRQVDLCFFPIHVHKTRHQHAHHQDLPLYDCCHFPGSWWQFRSRDLNFPPVCDNSASARAERKNGDDHLHNNMTNRAFRCAQLPCVPSPWLHVTYRHLIPLPLLHYYITV